MELVHIFSSANNSSPIQRVQVRPPPQVQNPQLVKTQRINLHIWRRDPSLIHLMVSNPNLLSLLFFHINQNQKWMVYCCLFLASLGIAHVCIFSVLPICRIRTKLWFNRKQPFQLINIKLPPSFQREQFSPLFSDRVC